MARKNVNPQLVEGKLLLDTVGRIQETRATLKRVNDIMDFTRSGADFAALGVALGVSAADAETIYARMKAIQTTMDGVDFQNLSEIDQG